jgi:hypothetical protein
MRIQDIHDALTEYDHSEKPWWRKIVGTPTVIKKIKLFATNLSAPPLLPDPTRQLTDVEMFQFYQLLLPFQSSEDRSYFGWAHDHYSGGEKFDEYISTYAKSSHGQIAARVFHKNFRVLTLEFLNPLKISQGMFTTVAKHPKNEALKDSIKILKENNLLSETNFTALAQHPNPEKLSKTLKALEDRSLLTQERFDSATGHADPEQVAMAAKPRTTDIRSHLATYDLKKGFFRRYVFRKDPPDIAQLRALVNTFGNEDRPLTESEDFSISKLFYFPFFSNFDYLNESPENLYVVKPLKNHANPEHALLQHLGYFHDLLTPDLFEIFKTNPAPDNIHWVLFNIEHLFPNCMTQEILSLLFKNKNSAQLDTIFLYLHKEKITTPENFAAIVRLLKQPNEASFSSLEYLILQFKFFNQVNFTVIADNPDPDSLRYTLQRFIRLKLLTQADFADAVKYAHVLGCRSVLSALHKRFKNNLDGYLETYARMLAFCKTYKGSQENFLPAVLRLIQIGTEVKFDRPGNTHTESVHKTASESAVRLLANYGEDINTHEKFQIILSEVGQWTKTLSGISGEAAQRGLKLLQMPEANYLDEASQVTVLQLLALFWKAIHDETKRASSTTLEEAKSLLSQALYETQRGNNLVLNERGALVDDLQEDNIICIPGAFNKLIEKLFTIHPDAEMQSVTLAGALAKFPIVVQEEASKHLISLRKTMESDAFGAMVLELKGDGGIDIIWPHIEKAVNSQMMDEYGVLYKTKDFPDGINHPKYQLVLHGLPYIELTKLPAYADSELLTSKASSAMYSEKPSSPLANKALSGKEEAYQPPENGF